MSFGENALREFRVVLGDVETNLAFVNSASQLRPRLGKLLIQENLDPSANQLVREFIDQKSVEITLVYRGMYILLCGGFEDFIRRLIRDVVISVNDSVKNYADLPDKIRMQNRIRTGHVLITAGSPPDHLTIDYDALCKNLGTCLENSRSYVLNTEAFAMLVSNVTPDHLNDLFERVGIAFDWDEFGRTPSLREVFETSATRETANATKDYLKRFVQMRNKISHTGSGGITLSDSDVSQAIAFFGAFSETLVKIVAQRL